MMQRHQPHPAGTFAICDACHREPKHIVIAGGSFRETVDVRTCGTGERHVLEDARCGRATARHPFLDAAVAEWSSAYAMRVVGQRRQKFTTAA